jgi:hypothetical protein
MADEDIFWFRFAVQSARLRGLPTGPPCLHDGVEPERHGSTHVATQRGVLGPRMWTHVEG